MSRQSSSEVKAAIDTFVATQLFTKPDGTPKKNTSNAIVKQASWEALKGLKGEALLAGLQSALVQFPSRLGKQDRYRGHLLRLASAVQAELKTTEAKVADDDSFAIDGFDDRAYPAGNEQFIAVPDEMKQARDFVLVGTSVLQNIKLALELRANATVKPSIIVVDNSPSVILFWEKLKTVTEASATPGDFTSRLTAIREACIAECCAGTSSLFDGNASERRLGVIAYLEQMIDTHGFEVVKMLIGGARVISGDWCDAAGMESIKKEAAGRPVVAYPSNIVAFIDDAAGFYPGASLQDGPSGDEGAKSAISALFNSIKMLVPTVTLHTNIDRSNLKPSTALWFERAGPQTAEQALSTLFHSDQYRRKPCNAVSAVATVDGDVRIFSEPYARRGPGWTATMARGDVCSHSGGGGGQAPVAAEVSDAAVPRRPGM